MTALLPMADICRWSWDVRQLPLAEVAAFDHLIGDGEYVDWEWSPSVGKPVSLAARNEKVGNVLVHLEYGVLHLVRGALVLDQRNDAVPQPIRQVDRPQSRPYQTGNGLPEIVARSVQ